MQWLVYKSIDIFVEGKERLNFYMLTRDTA